MVMTDFFSVCCQYWNSLAVTCYQFGIAVYIHHFELKEKLCLQFMQSGNHVLAQMTVFATIDDQVIYCRCH